MPRKGDNIYKRKDGRWEGRYIKGRRNGRTIFGSVFAGTYREARAKLAKARCTWNAGLAVTRKERTKLKTVSECWLRESEAFLKESTTAIYKGYLRRQIHPMFAKTDMADISNEALSEFCITLLENGGADGQGLSPKTVSEVFLVMKQLRKFAMLRGIVVGYSADCVEIKQKSKPLRVFSQTELERLHAHLDRSSDRSHLGIRLCLSTGLRLGELCALTWDDISLKEQHLHVCRTLQRIRNDGREGTKTKIVITSPKSACSIRTIPLTDRLCSALAPTWQPGAYFLTGDTERYMEPRTMQNHFKAVLDAVGIEDANFHALRHTFATQCVEADVDVKCLSEILGHSSVSITLDRYVHPTMEWKRQNIEKVASMEH
ncbi:MAG: site-specific integrase [Selenomonadaceae bacterium]|nr:site-specific integrase [Selenomonadaceae bacterium]